MGKLEYELLVGEYERGFWNLLKGLPPRIKREILTDNKSIPSFEEAAEHSKEKGEKSCSEIRQDGFVCPEPCQYYAKSPANLVLRIIGREKKSK